MTAAAKLELTSIDTSITGSALLPALSSSAQIPHDKICVTTNATLGFHAAWDFGAKGHTITNPIATQMLYSSYPLQVRRWIARRGGLTPQMIFLRGKQLQAMYRPCYLDAQASTNR